MKFTKEHYSILSAAIKSSLNRYTKEELTKGIEHFISNSKANNKYIAFIWSVFFKVRRENDTLNNMISNNSLSTRRGKQYNDSHIETALKAIFTEYGFKKNSLQLNY